MERGSKRAGRGKKLKKNPRRLFAMRLALALGFYDVDEMLDTCGTGQLNEWAAYYTLEPFGEPWKRSSLQAARTINTLYGIAAGLGGQKLKESDLIDDEAFVPRACSKQDATKEQRLRIRAIRSLDGFGVNNGHN